MAEQTFAYGAVRTPSRARTARDSRLPVLGGRMVIRTELVTTIVGLVALVADHRHGVSPERTLSVDLTGWGRIPPVVGVLALALGAAWARVVAVLQVGLSVLAHLPASPARSLIVIAVDVPV